jgi:GNAT superfamily N-acetyltransferase
MANTTFRQCNSADLTTVRQFVEQLYLADPGVKPGFPSIDLTFAEFERHPAKGRIVVFEQAGKLVGYAILVFFWSNEYGGDIVDIDEILVDESSRSGGIGTDFFRWLDSEYSNSAGYSLQTFEKNERARRLYINMGFAVSANQHFIKLRS